MVQAIEENKEIVEEIVIQETIPMDSMQQLEVYQEYPEVYPDYSGDYGNYE